MAAKRPPEDPPTVDDEATGEAGERSAGGPGPADEQAPGSPGPADRTGATHTPPPRPAEHRFFTWMRSLGIVRQPGWIGGVSTGIADRLGIDPLIVRGIFVVVAILGGPALLLYAAAWLLLPDHNNKIHLEQLIRGTFEAPIAGIGVMVLLSMLPITQGFWFAGASFWGAPYWDVSFGRVFWTLVVLGAIVAFVLWVARRSARNEPTVMPATTDDRPDTIPQPRREDAAGTSNADTVAAPGSTAAPDSTATTGSTPAPGTASFVASATGAATAPPPAPAAPADASAEELAAWRQQQALWKQQNAEWKAQQSATERELRQQRAVEARDRALASAAEAAERRRLHMLANPRISGAAAWGVIGAAIVGGGLTALVAAGSPELSGYEVTIGLAVAAIIFGASIIVAGALRKRSGILSFLATLVILATLATAAVPRDRQLLALDAGVGPGTYSQLFGTVYVYAHDGMAPGATDIWQGSGRVQIDIAEGASARIEVVGPRSDVIFWRLEGTTPRDFEMHAEPVTGTMVAGDEHRYVIEAGAELATEQSVIRIWQGSGSVHIQDENQRATTEEVTP